jgi:transcription elongation GreA/GreB family factor
LSREAFDVILANLIKLEERTEDIFREYFPTPSRERSETIRLIDQYVAQLERILEAVEVCGQGSSEFPYAVIGTSVALQVAASPEVFTNHLVNPFEEKVGFDDVSFLSPLGKALTWKRVGDTVSVRAPEGVFAYTIRSVTVAPDKRAASP